MTAQIQTQADAFKMIEDAIAANEAATAQASKCAIEFVCYSAPATMALIVDATGAFRFGSPLKARRFSQGNADRAATHWNANLPEGAKHLTVEAMSVERALMAHTDSLRSTLAALKAVD